MHTKTCQQQDKLPFPDIILMLHKPLAGLVLAGFQIVCGAWPSRRVLLISTSSHISKELVSISPSNYSKRATGITKMVEKSIQSRLIL